MVFRLKFENRTGFNKQRVRQKRIPRKFEHGSRGRGRIRSKGAGYGDCNRFWTARREG